MANIQFDPIVRGINKTLGNFSYATRNGKSYIRMRPSKPRRASEGQTRQKQKFAEVAQCWSALPDQVKKSWRTRCPGTDLSEYNIFFSENLRRHKKDQILMMTPVSGFALPPDLSVSSDAEGSIAVRFTQTAEPLCLTLVMQKPDAEGKVFFSTEVKDSTASPTYLKGFVSGERVMAYCIFSDKALAEGGKCFSSCGIAVTIK